MRLLKSIVCGFVLIVLIVIILLLIILAINFNHILTTNYKSIPIASTVLYIILFVVFKILKSKKIPVLIADFNYNVSIKDNEYYNLIYYFRLKSNLLIILFGFINVIIMIYLKYTYDYTSLENMVPCSLAVLPFLHTKKISNEIKDSIFYKNTINVRSNDKTTIVLSGQNLSQIVTINETEILHKTKSWILLKRLKANDYIVLKSETSIHNNNS